MKTSWVMLALAALGLVSCATRDCRPVMCYSLRHEAYSEMVQADLRSLFRESESGTYHPNEEEIIRNARRAHAATCASLALVAISRGAMNVAYQCISEAIVLDPDQMEYAATKIVVLRARGHGDLADRLIRDLGGGATPVYVRSMLLTLSGAAISDEDGVRLSPCEKAFLAYLRDAAMKAGLP